MSYSVAKEKLFGMKRFDAIKYTNIVNVMSKEINRGKTLPEFFYLRGKAYLLLSMNKKASLDFERASVLKPDSIKYKKMLAASLLLAGDYAKSLDSMAGAPEKNFFNLIKGACLYKTGKPEEAMTYLDHYMEKAPRDAAGHYQKARCLMALGKFDEAQKSFRRSLRLGGDVVENMTWLAMSVMVQDKKRAGVKRDFRLAA